jgi:serine/threonine protein phosphatase PrpC
MATMHGWRETMEDDHTVELSLPKHPDAGYFGIFDGHSGAECAKYVAKRLVTEIDALPTFDHTEMARTCLRVDQEFLDDPQFAGKEDGCAGIFTVVQTQGGPQKTYKIINANIGDSRTVLARYNNVEGKVSYSAQSCTEDHKPSDPKEKTRIENAGGSVSAGRVDGQLALSRAFGDRQLKTPHSFAGEARKVTANPDFTEFDGLTENDFLLLCCDGIYEGDVFDRQGVIDWVTKKLDETNDTAVVCGLLLDECLTRGSHDNMSAMIIQFKDGTSYHSEEKWEYVPGPWFDGDDVGKFQAAYAADALAAGVTVEKARAMRRQLEERSPAPIAAK